MPVPEPEAEIEPEPEPQPEAEIESEPEADYGSKWYREAFKKRNFFDNIMPLDDTEGILKDTPVCLYQLYKAVKFRGGFDCIRQESWPIIARFCDADAVAVPKMMENKKYRYRLNFGGTIDSRCFFHRWIRATAYSAGDNKTL